MSNPNRKTEYSYTTKVMTLFLLLVWVGIFSTGCIGNKEEKEDVPVADFKNESVTPTPVPNNVSTAAKSQQPAKPKMVTYDVVAAGRSDPFAPRAELDAYAKARSSAIAEANARNAEVERLRKLKGQSIKEADDINPYNFNLPTPPTGQAPADSPAVKITKTKVVGIMYNKNNPSAILNIDNKDYLVRQGDKIIDQEYKVMQINPNWITVGWGANVYSASIGELFTKDDLNGSKNDLYNLQNRFGGRRG